MRFNIELDNIHGKTATRRPSHNQVIVIIVAVAEYGAMRGFERRVASGGVETWVYLHDTVGDKHTVYEDLYHGPEDAACGVGREGEREERGIV